MDICSRTNIGMVRTENEDSIYVSDNNMPMLAVVADGMGGQTGGKQASSVAIEVFSSELKEKLSDVGEEELKNAAVKANEEILRRAGEDEALKGMGTTLAAAVFDEKNVTCVNVGDSRIYLLDKNGLRRISKDHKYVQYLVDKGLMTAEEAAVHPYRNIITRALGMEEVEADSFKFSWETGDTVLICSDGLYEEVGEEDIERVLMGEGSAEKKAELLLRLALQNGGHDNVSVITAINDGILGMIIKNRFEVRELVAEGGMSRVYRAYDRKDNRTVAVKVLKKEFSKNEQIVRGFLREGETTSKLQHKNIVRTIDFGSKNSLRYIVMEYIEGCTLADIMLERRLTTEECVRTAQKLLSALSYAHHKGLVHKDLKPHNILIDVEGEPYITDFGIAEEIGAEERKKDEKVVGSVSYFSPEQARGEKVGPASDIYSLGIMLYEMCTGKLPFVAEDNLAVALMHLHTPPTPPKELNEELPESLNKIILKAIEKQPEMRYRSASAMGRDVARSLSDPGGAYIRTGEKQKEGGRRSGRLIIILSVTMTLIGFISWGLISLIGQVNQSRDIYMPYLVDMTEEDALGILKEYDMDLNVDIVYEKEIESDDGTVISQEPESGTLLEKNDDVKVTVCKYTEDSVMPYIVGLDEEDAMKRLSEKGIKSENIVLSQTNDFNIKNGKVSQQYPESGTKLPENTQVIVYVNRIFEYTEGVAPNMFGLDVDDAISGLELYSPKNIFVTENYTDTDEYESVYKQYPEKGAVINGITSVRLFINQRPADFEGTYSIPWDVLSALKNKKNAELVITIDTQYSEVPALLSIYDAKTTYEEAVRINGKPTKFVVYLPEMSDTGSTKIHYYVDGEEIAEKSVYLKRIKNNE